MQYAPPPHLPPPGPPEPVIVCMGRVLVAFDPAGSVVWSFLAETAIQRLFRIGARVLVLSGEDIVCVDLHSGRHVGTVALGFQPEAGLVCGTDLVLANGTSSGGESPRIACLSSDGAIKWKGTVAVAGTENVLRTYGIDGGKRSEIRYARSGYRAGILHGSVVAQPDRD